jgi:class 3 adenylate cyclase
LAAACGRIAMKFIECLASYVPGLICDQLIKDCDEHKNRVTPWRQEYETVCVFCDVSGFTALSETMALNGKGAEGLARHLNSYFSQMVRIIAADGGDVFKFAGDAMIVLWPECSSGGDMETTVRRATQCAISIQENLDKSVMEEGVQLSVKIGIGFGRVSVLHVGGVYGRVEYLAVGEPLIQAFHAEHQANSGQVICSKEVWKIIHDYFPSASICDDGSVRIDLELKQKIKLIKKSSKMNTLRNNMSDTDPILENRMKAYVAGAVLPKLNRDSPEDEQWGNELRRCTVMFVNLGMKEQHLLASAVYDEALTQVHEVLRTVQKSVYQYEGSINKFLMDDKGSTLIACFGLPPVSHDDDPTRAILASLLLCEGLYDLGLIASVGITTGDVFCGVVGSKTRREYTVLGDSVNLSARLMQKACVDGGGVLCDWDTKTTSNGTLHFQNLGEIRVKGKSMPVKIFRPYPPNLIPITSGSKGPNVYRAIHLQQLQNAIVHKSLLGCQAMFMSGRSASTTERFRSDSDTTSGVPSVAFSSSPIIEATPGRRQSAIMDQMRVTGPVTRTRRSVVRSSIASSSTCAITKALEAINIHQAPSSQPADMTKSPEPSRRGSATSYPLNCNTSGPNPRNPINRMDSNNLSSRIDKPIEIEILFPNGLSAEYSTIHHLPSIFTHQVKHLDELKETILKSAHENSQILFSEQLSNLTAQDVSFNILGTRFFLPDGPYPIRWLSVLNYEAKSEFPDHWKFGDSIQLIICLKSEVRKIQSRLALAHRTLIEKKIILIESRRGSVLFIEGEMGVGKTDLLTKFIHRTIPNTLPIYYLPSSPYSIESFGPFTMFLQQYLDSHALLEGGSRTSMLYDLLLRGGDELLFDGPLLDGSLGTKLGEVLAKQVKKLSCPQEVSMRESILAVHRILTPSERASRRLVLYFYLFLTIGCEESLILIVDDVHLIDDDSWALILLLSLAINGASTTVIADTLGSAPLPSFFSTLGRLPSILLIVSGRPLIKHRSVFRNSCPIYNTFLKTPDLVILKLDGLPPEETEQYLISRLGGNVRYISEQFVQLVNEKCMGNPWMMGQLVDAFRSARPPLLSSNVQQDLLSAAALGQLSIDDQDDGSPTKESHGGTSHQHQHHPIVPTLSLTPLSMKNSIRKLFGSSVSDPSPSTPRQEIQIDLVDEFTVEMCPLPSPIAQTFGTLLDRLNSCQQMILKTASYIGRQFSWAYLYNCYPLTGHKYRLRKELQGLLTQGYLIEVPSTIPIASSEGNQTYYFVSDFLLNLITIRMLTEQKEKIKLLVEKYQLEIEAKQRRVFAKKAMPFANANTPLKVGWLKIQKKVTESLFKINIKRKLQGGDWKSRYCVVSPNTPSTPANISLYRDEAHFHTTPSTPTQTIFLHNAFAQIEPEYAQHEEKYVFRVDATQYLKDKTTLEENRSFLFAGLSLQDITDWVYMIKYTIELVTDFHRVSIRKSNSELIPVTGAGAVMGAGATTATAVAADIHFEVFIHSVKNISYSEVYNSLQCYVNPVIDDDDLMKTQLSFDVTNDHHFNEIFQFSLTKRQWLRSQLIVNIKSLDLLLTDDLLGAMMITLNKFPLLEEEEKTVTEEEKEKEEMEGKVKDNIPSESKRSENEVFSSMKWYPLYHTLKHNTHCGEISLSFKFSLSSELEQMLERNHNSFEELKASIELLLHEEDILAAQVPLTAYPTRIIDMKSLKSLFELYETSGDAEQRKQRQQLHQSSSLTSESSLSSSSSSFSLSSSSSSCQQKKINVTLTSTSIFTQQLSEKIHKLLRHINDEGHDTHVTTSSGSVNKMWVCSQFREILKEFERSDSFNFEETTELQNPFKHVLEQASTLDQQHLDWLASQYTRDDSMGTPDTLSSRSRESSFSSIVASREESLQKKARRSSILRLERQASLTNRLSLTLGGMNSTTVCEPLLFDPSADIDQEYYCLDQDGNQHGPYPAMHLYTWLVRNLIHLQLPISHGHTGQGEYYPLGMYERTFRRIANNLITQWPLLNKTSLEEMITTVGSSSSSSPLSSPPLTLTMGVFADPNHVIHHFYRWDFNIWNLELHELLPLSMMLMSSLGLSESFDMQIILWKNFMDEVQELMMKHKNPYHNYYHVLDVTQTCFVFLSEMGGFELLRSYEILALIVGALCHDLDHPGLNNLYQVNARTSLAMDYNDISVLENHHCSLAFSIINQAHCQIFATLDQMTFKIVRKLMISLILATDMTSHFTLKSELDDLIIKKFSFSHSHSNETIINVGTVILDDKEREVILKTILHTADISNPAKIWKISKKWSDLVIEEFFQQGDLEKQEGLPISPNMDRLTTSQDELSVNFIDFIVAPYFFSLTNIFPKLCSCIDENLAMNREIWHQMIMKRLGERESESDGQEPYLHNNSSSSVNGIASVAETIHKWGKRKTAFEATQSTVRENSKKLLQVI